MKASGVIARAELHRRILLAALGLGVVTALVAALWPGEK
jgi:hypothetical protein